MESSLALDTLARRLSRYPQLGGLAAALLHAGGPFSFFAAQALYLSQSALSAFIPAEEMAALVDALEDPAQLEAFARRLESNSG